MNAAVASLLEVARRRCEGPVSVVTDEPSLWRGSGVELVAPDALGGSGPSGSQVLAVDLAQLDAGEREALIAEAWSAVRPGATLVLLAPNPAAHEDPDGLIERREVKRLLRPCGRVQKWKDQPFRWLAFACLKRGGGRQDVADDELARYRVTADLCRGRVLELGCGRGDLSGLLLERGHEITACDLAARKVEEAARRHPAGTFLHSDILELDLPAASFDTVLLPEVLEHVEAADGERLLDKAWSFVAPGGRFVVTVPNGTCIPHANHVREFDRAGLAALLRRFGEPVFSVDQPYKWLMATVIRSD